MSLSEPELAPQQPAAATLHLQLHQISVRFPLETASAVTYLLSVPVLMHWRHLDRSDISAL